MPPSLLTFHATTVGTPFGAVACFLGIGIDGRGNEIDGPGGTGIDIGFDFFDFVLGTLLIWNDGRGRDNDKDGRGGDGSFKGRSAFCRSARALASAAFLRRSSALLFANVILCSSWRFLASSMLRRRSSSDFLFTAIFCWRAFSIDAARAFASSCFFFSASSFCCCSVEPVFVFGTGSRCGEFWIDGSLIGGNSNDGKSRRGFFGSDVVSVTVGTTGG
mmetsp:Transcript_14130/g.33996  ORF Transcript_14130/g.33996 Transcript_14130/m.33996 type:complete len:218 (+) Transcript_14130:1733-2386(+)